MKYECVVFEKASRSYISRAVFTFGLRIEIFRNFNFVFRARIFEHFKFCRMIYRRFFRSDRHINWLAENSCIVLTHFSQMLNDSRNKKPNKIHQVTNQLTGRYTVKFVQFYFWVQKRVDQRLEWRHLQNSRWKLSIFCVYACVPLCSHTPHPSAQGVQ